MAISEPRLVLEKVDFHYTSRGTLLRRKRHHALRNISFQVNAGETLGVIGGNGSGKSTLLKVIRGIYGHDSGRIERNYQKGALLALGVGFDNELTGQQNILLSGILSGARRKEVEAKKAEIIDFSELHDAIDKPLKTYSTGMRARLGFSIAVAMDSDLILIDEVLSVGDAGFRKKAMAAMKQRITANQAAIFVSHSLAQVKELCDRVMWLDMGQIKLIDEAGVVIEAFVAAQTRAKIEPPA